MLEGVIFDMDGLMFDTEPIWSDAWAPVIEGLGSTCPPELADAVRGTSGSSMEAIIHRFVPDVDASVVRERVYEVVHERVLAGVPKKRGLDELLDYLSELGIPLAVASSSSLEVIDTNLRNGGIREQFGHLFTGVGMANPKPAPDLFLATAKAMGTNPAETLVLEDSLSGVRAGVAGGFTTVMVPDLVAPDDYAKEHATMICADLLEVRDAIEAGRLGH